jgi:acyl-CoA synthetase (AMP-forming)/AMP-acid ligase II
VELASRQSAFVAALRRLREVAPDRPLIHHPASGRVVDANALWQAHLTYAEQLRSAGLRRGQVVLSVVGNHPGFVALTVACRALLLTLVPVEAGTTMAEIIELANGLAAAALVVADGVVTPGLQQLPLSEGLVLAVCDLLATEAAEGAAIMKVTSGSTGPSRTTVTTETQLLADARHIVTGMRIGRDDTQLAVIPLSHSYGFSSLVMPLLAQGTPFVLRESFIPSNVSADARDYGARVFPGVPFMFQRLLADPPAAGWPPTLRKLISAGAPLPLETARAFVSSFGVKIRSFYGTSETGGIAYDDGDESEVSDGVGRPLPGVTVTLLAHANGPAGAGRVFVRSEAVSSGYTGGLHEAFRDGGYVTDDLGTFDERGLLTLTGRVSTFVNVAGKKVEPSEVERVLRMLPGVSDAHVTAAPDALRGEQVVACLVADASLTVLTVRQFCTRRLASHKIPRTILFLDAIPRTSRGKVDRRTLEALVIARAVAPARLEGE